MPSAGPPCRDLGVYYRLAFFLSTLFHFFNYLYLFIHLFDFYYFLHLTISLTTPNNDRLLVGYRRGEVGASVSILHEAHVTTRSSLHVASSSSSDHELTGTYLLEAFLDLPRPRHGPRRKTGPQ